MGTAADVEQIALVTVGDGPKRISVASYSLTIIGNGSGQYGIYLESAGNISLTGNTIRGSGGTMSNGIYVDAGCNGSAIGTNVVDTSTVTTPYTKLSGAANIIGSANLGFTV